MTWGTADLTVRFGDRTALDRVTVRIEPGLVHAVIGGDGAGKSTLLRMLAGLGLDHDGTVRLPDQERISQVPSDGGFFADLTVEENLAFVAAVYRLRGWRSRAHELLSLAGIDRFGDRRAGHLSGGQRRKLAGAMGLLPEPELLVLDEVTTGVDPLSRIELWRMVAAAASAGTAVVAATTYLDEAERADRVELLHDGRVLSSGRPDDIVASIPGRVVDLPEPTHPATAWRHGARWRQWEPEHDGGTPPTLEDAAIVLELVATGRTS